jgi:hypothetical protein
MKSGDWTSSPTRFASRRHIRLLNIADAYPRAVPLGKPQSRSASAISLQRLDVRTRRPSDSQRERRTRIPVGVTTRANHFIKCQRDSTRVRFSINPNRVTEPEVIVVVLRLHERIGVRTPIGGSGSWVRPIKTTETAPSRTLHNGDVALERPPGRTGGRGRDRLAAGPPGSSEDRGALDGKQPDQRPQTISSLLK